MITKELLRLLAIGVAVTLMACGNEDRAGASTDTADAGEEDVPRREQPSDTDRLPDLGPPDDDSGDDADTLPEVEPPDPETGPGPARCGNGIRETGEVCDGDDLLTGASCSSQGFIGGELGCTETCTFDTSDCYAELCGDEIISGSEECDGDLLNDATCASLGFAPNGDDEVTCADSCQYDTSQCSDFICGNDNVEVGFEVCDGDNFDGTTCRSLGFFAGALECSADCQTIDESGCVENICGNGTIEGPEVCDGTLAAVTCRDVEFADGQTYAGGLIGCSADCLELDTSGCVEDIADLGPDRDGDGIPDDVDNCPDDANPRQLDFNGNGVGNVCDDAVIFDIIVDEEDANELMTTGDAEPGGGGFGIDLGSFEVDLPLVVDGATIAVVFDDEGVATIVGLTIMIGESSTEVDIDLGGGGGGFPLPIPIGDIDLVVDIHEGEILGITTEFIVSGLDDCEGDECDEPCEGEECDEPCEGDECDEPCEGDECDEPCEGDECDEPCEGDECDEPCEGDECDEPCEGDECDEPCEGDECDEPCEGDECDEPCEGAECEGEPEDRIESYIYRVDSDFTQYISGEIEGSNSVFEALFSLEGSASGSFSIDEELVEMNGSSTHISIFDRVYTLTFNDPDVELGTFTISIDPFGGGGGFPIPIPLDIEVDVTLTGLAGRVIVRMAD